MELPLHIRLQTLPGFGHSQGSPDIGEMASGSCWAIDRARTGLAPQTAEERRALQLPSFSLKHPVSLEGLASFWIVVGKWNWAFPVLLCCVWEILKWLWAVFGMNVLSLACVSLPILWWLTDKESSSASLPSTGLATCGRKTVSETGWQNRLRTCPHSGWGRGAFLSASFSNNAEAGRSSHIRAVPTFLSFKHGILIIYSCVACWKGEMACWIHMCHFGQYFLKVGAKVI